jgi:hypothetical protein
MSGGCDATILRFSLQSAPDPFSGPLVLRLFQATVDAQRAPHEAAVQNARAELDYPAPRVFIAEARIEPLGGPFLIMELMPGRTIGSELEGLSIRGLGRTLKILWQLPRIRLDRARVRAVLVERNSAIVCEVGTVAAYSAKAREIVGERTLFMLDICDQCGSGVNKKLLRCSDGTAVYHRECVNGHKLHRTTSKEDQGTTDSHHLTSYVIVEACDCS